jgi:hypothetical protein
MINVGIISEKENVAFHMASVVCKAGAHAERFDVYEFENIKKFNIVVIDLDNATASYKDIKNSSDGIKDIVVAGFSRSNEIMDEFRPIMQVFLKPFKSDHFTTFIANLKQITKTDQVINNEEVPIYQPTGKAIVEGDKINVEVFSDEELSQRLARIINEKYKGPSEKEFLKQMKLDIIPVIPKPEPEPVDIVTVLRVIDFSQQFVEDALTKYRAQKLRAQHLSDDEVSQKVKSLLINDATRSNQEINIDDVSKKFDESNVLKEAFKEKNQFGNIHAVETFEKIEQQRHEAIYDNNEDNSVKMDEKVPQSVQNNNFTETELKYIKRSDKSKLIPEETQPVKNTGLDSKLVPQRQSADVNIDKSKAIANAQSKMTPEQIERLRKLGVKI